MLKDINFYQIIKIIYSRSIESKLLQKQNFDSLLLKFTIKMHVKCHYCVSILDGGKKWKRFPIPFHSSLCIN